MLLVSVLGIRVSNYKHIGQTLRLKIVGLPATLSQKLGYEVGCKGRRAPVSGEGNLWHLDPALPVVPISTVLTLWLIYFWNNWKSWNSKQELVFHSPNPPTSIYWHPNPHVLSVFSLAGFLLAIPSPSKVFAAQIQLPGVSHSSCLPGWLVRSLCSCRFSHVFSALTNFLGKSFVKWYHIVCNLTHHWASEHLLLLKSWSPLPSSETRAAPVPQWFS